MQQKIIHRIEKDRLLQVLERTEGMGLQIRLVAGAAGSGKSILLNSFMESAAKSESRWIIAGTSCPVWAEQPEPYQTFRDILQMVVNEVNRRREEQKTKKEKWNRALGISADILLKVAPDLVGNFVPMGSLINSVGDKVMAGTGLQKKIDRLKGGKEGVLAEVGIDEQYAEVLKMVVKHYPLLICIDNLQWLDRSSIELLHRICEVLKQEPFVLIGGFRSNDIRYLSGSERHPLEAFITHALVEYRDALVDLDACDTAESLEFTRKLIQQEVDVFDDDFLRKLYRRTGGNPLFINEILKTFKEKGNIVEAEDKIRKVTGEINWQVRPLRTEGIIRERLAGMDEKCVHILNVSAVQGEEFLLQVSARLAEQSLEEARVILVENLEKQYHVVQELNCFRLKEEVVSSFGFVSCFFREYLYERMSAALRMKLHGEVAKVLEELYAECPERVYRELLFHYECSGEYQKALQYAELYYNRCVESKEFECLPELVVKALELLKKAGKTSGIEDCREKWYLRRVRYNRIVKRQWEKEEIEMLPRGQVEIFRESWIRVLAQGRLQEALKMAENFCEEVKGDYMKVNYGKQAVAIVYYWLGDYQTCREKLAGVTESVEDAEWRTLYRMYSALSAFQMGEYEEVASWSSKGETGDQYIDLLEVRTEIWLAFLDGDYERMELINKDLKANAARYGFRMLEETAGLFDAVVMARKRTWQGISALQEAYEKLGVPLLITLYGVMLCRVLFEKELYVEMTQEGQKVLKSAEKMHIGAYREELERLVERPEKEVGI